MSKLDRACIVAIPVVGVVAIGAIFVAASVIANIII